MHVGRATSEVGAEANAGRGGGAEATRVVCQRHEVRARGGLLDGRLASLRDGGGRCGTRVRSDEEPGQPLLRAEAGGDELGLN